MLQILLAVFGLIGILKGEFKVTSNRRVEKGTGRVLGVIMLIGAALPFFAPAELGCAIMIGTLVLVVGIGLAVAKPI